MALRLVPAASFASVAMSTLASSSRAPQLLVAPDVAIPADAVIGANVVLHAGVVLGTA